MKLNQKNYKHYKGKAKNNQLINNEICVQLMMVMAMKLNLNCECVNEISNEVMKGLKEEKNVKSEPDYWIVSSLGQEGNGFLVSFLAFVSVVVSVVDTINLIESMCSSVSMLDHVDHHRIDIDLIYYFFCCYSSLDRIDLFTLVQQEKACTVLSVVSVCGLCVLRVINLCAIVQ